MFGKFTLTVDFLILNVWQIHLNSRLSVREPGHQDGEVGSPSCCCSHTLWNSFLNICRGNFFFWLKIHLSIWLFHPTPLFFILLAGNMFVCFDPTMFPTVASKPSSLSEEKMQQGTIQRSDLIGKRANACWMKLRMSTLNTVESTVVTSRNYEEMIFSTAFVDVQWNQDMRKLKTPW